MRSGRVLPALLAVATLAPLLQAARQTGPVYVDDSQAASRGLVEARRHGAEGRAGKAAQIYRRLLERHPRKVVVSRAGEPLHTDLAVRVRRILESNRPLRRAFRQRYGAAADRALAAATRPRVDAAGLRAVMRDFPTCRAALEAGLRLAAHELERAEPSAARAVLERLRRHPDRSAERGRWHGLRAAAAHYAGRADAAQKHLRRLRDAPEQRARVERWLGPLEPPRTPARFDPLAPLPAAEPPERAKKPLWSISVASDRDENRNRRLDPAPFFRTLPVAEGERLYVNDGRSIRALDRTSGARRWRHALAERSRESAGGRRFGRRGRDRRAQRGVLVRAGMAWGVLGTPRPASPRRRDSAGTQLIAVGSEGKVLWRQKPAELDPALEGADFHGTPVGGPRRVIATLHRAKRSGFQDAFVAAVDGRNGELLWKRHLVSVSAARREGARGLIHARLAEGSLYLTNATSPGVAARLDPVTGRIRWLRLRRPSGDGAPPGGLRPAIPPVLLAGGVLVPSDGAGLAAALLEKRTGIRRKRLESEPWFQAEQILPAPSGVVTVGAGLHRFDSSLERIWSRSPTKVFPGPVAGRAVVAGRHVYVPTKEALVAVALDNGERARRIPSDGPGNALVAGRQLVLVSEKRLRAHLPFAAARERLERRMENAPAEPGPALALLRLAHRHDRGDLVAHAAKRAVRAARRRVAQRGETEHGDEPRPTFERIAALATPGKTGSPKLRRTLLRQLGALASRPGESVAYHFAMARHWQRRGEPARAIEHCQAVLRSPKLARTLYRAPGERRSGARQARIEARSRLRKLLASTGPGGYERYGRRAERALSALQARNESDPARWLRVAERFPFAEAALEARLQAARLFAESGRPDRALSALHRAYRTARDDAKRERVIGAILARHLELGRAAAARRWLERVARRHPDLEPRGPDGERLPLPAWRKRLAGIGSDPGRAIVGPRFEATRKRTGVLLLPEAGASAGRTRSGLCTLENRTLRYFSGPKLAPQWRKRLPEGGARLLLQGRKRLVLYLPGPGELRFLATADGRELREPIAVRSRLEDLGTRRKKGAAARAFERMIGAGRVEIRGGRVVRVEETPEAALHAAANHLVLCVADERGRTLGIDRNTGRILWRFASPLDHLRSLAVGPGACALAGAVGIGSGAPSGMLTAIDPITGEPRVNPIETETPLDWCGLGGPARVVRASPRRVAAHRLADGAVSWRTRTPGGSSASGDGGPAIEGALTAKRLLLRVPGGELVLMDARSGDVLRRGVAGVTSHDPPRYIGADGDRLLLLRAGGLTSLDAAGRVRWRDAIADAAKPLLAIARGPARVAILARGAADAARRVLVLDRDTGRLRASAALADWPPRAGRPTIGLMENHVVVGAGARTYAVHAPVEAP